MTGRPPDEGSGREADEPVREDDGPAPTPRRRTGLVAAVALTALLVVYLVLVAGRAVDLVRTGEPVGIALGVAFGVLPILVLVLVAREWVLAMDVQKMADTLAARGELPEDDLPRSPGGRIDREAALGAFDAYRLQAEQAGRGEWGPWYRLAFAYDAAGDRRHARAALRTASRIHRGRD